MSYTITKQANGLFKVRVWSKRDALGKRKSKQEKDISGFPAAKRRAQEIEYELEENIVDITFKKLDDLHFEERKTKVSPVTLATIYKNDRKIARDFLGNIKAKDINTRIMQQFVDKLQSKGLKKKSVKNYVSYILSVINWGVNFDYLENNRIKRLYYKEDEEEFEATTLELEQIADILLFFKTHCYNLYIPTLISILTGSRRGETLGLTWDDIDFENNIIFFKNNMVTVNGKTLTKKTLKTKGSKRAVAMADFLKEEILEHKNKFAISKINNQVCANLFIGQINPDLLTHKFHDIMLSKFNIDIREHDLRHTFSQLVFENEDLLIIKSRMMGHSNTNITKTIYTKHKINQQMFNLVNTLGNEIKRLMCAKTCATA